MNFFKSKKGASILMVMFEIMVVITVVWMGFQIATSMANSETVNKALLAEDLSMLVNTMVAVPGDVEMGYPIGNLSEINVSKYNIVIVNDNNQIQVYLPDDTELNKAKRNFDLPDGYNVAGGIFQEEKFCLEKRIKIFY